MIVIALVWLHNIELIHKKSAHTLDLVDAEQIIECLVAALCVIHLCVMCLNEINPLKFPRPNIL